MEEISGRRGWFAVAAVVALLLGLAAGLLVVAAVRAPEPSPGPEPAAPPPPPPSQPAPAPAPPPSAVPESPPPADVRWTLRVEVKEADDRPVPGARALLLDAGDHLVAEALTGEDGAAALDVAGAATVLLEPGPGRLARRSPRLAPPAGGRRTFEFRLERTRTVEGVVLRANGTTPVYATVRARPVGPDPELNARTKFVEVPNDPSTGRFRIEGLSPGAAWIEAAPFDIHEGRKAGVRLEPGASEARILLPTPTLVRVRLVDVATGEPPDAPAEIRRVLPEGDEVLSFCTAGGFGAEGLDVEVLPGIPVRLRGAAEGYLPGDPVEVSLAEGETRGEARLVIVRDADAPRATFAFADEDGKPLAEVMLYRVFPESGNSAGQRYDLEEGRVTVPLFPGTHHFAVGLRDDDADPEDPWLRQEFDLTVARGDRVVREIRMVKGGFVRLRLDRKFRSSPVTLRSGETRLDRILRDDPSLEGAFLVSGVLPPGAWSVEIPGGPAWKDVVVRPGETADLEPPPR